MSECEWIEINFWRMRVFIIDPRPHEWNTKLLNLQRSDVCVCGCNSSVRACDGNNKKKIKILNDCDWPSANHYNPFIHSSSRAVRPHNRKNSPAKTYNINLTRFFRLHFMFMHFFLFRFLVLQLVKYKFKLKWKILILKLRYLKHNCPLPEAYPHTH